MMTLIISGIFPTVLPLGEASSVLCSWISDVILERIKLRNEAKYKAEKSGNPADKGNVKTS